MLVSVKRYGIYYNVDIKKGETKKQAIERAVRLKRLGKSYSGPTAAGEALPKAKKEVVVKKKPEVTYRVVDKKAKSNAKGKSKKQAGKKKDK